LEINILKDVVIIFALSTLVNLLFTKIKVPTIIGYMLTGILAGPHLLAIIESPHDIETMAEIGVILLMFTIGLEFSLNHLFRIRKIVFIGGFIQFFLTAGVSLLLARVYNLPWNGAIFIGFITALSSTAIVLKLLQERSELSSNYGRTVLGILIFQDLIVVPMLLFTPFLAGETTAIVIPYRLNQKSGAVFNVHSAYLPCIFIVYIQNGHVFGNWRLPCRTYGLRNRI
jgi:CPA2 family monovalent cation:H+ antiporter-2